MFFFSIAKSTVNVSIVKVNGEPLKNLFEIIFYTLYHKIFSGRYPSMVIFQSNVLFVSKLKCPLDNNEQ